MEGNTITPVKKEISKRPTGVIYIDRNKAFYYEQRLTAPLSFDIPPDSVSDLEVINKKKLDAIIKSFASANTLVPANIFILLSTTVTFEKEVPLGGVDADKSFQEFLEFIPFEEFLSKKVQLSGRTKIVAANKELCDTVESAFQSLGFVVGGVYPLSFCLEVMPELATNFDLNSVINKLPDLRNFNLVIPIVVNQNSPTNKQQINKKRLPIMIGVFGVLMSVLLFLVYRNILSPSTPPPVQQNVVNAPPPTSPPVATSSGQVEPAITSTPSGQLQIP